MTSAALYVLLAAPLLVYVCGAAVDQNTLQDVFGFAHTYKPADQVAAEANIQASAVTPSNGTLVDPDYWDSSDFRPSTADYDKFDWILTKHVASATESNFLISPLGLKLALAILTEAATGATQAELSNVLGFDLDRRVVRNKFSSIIDSLKKESSEYILNLGSRIYLEDSAKPRQRFAAIAQEFYKTDLVPLDFSNAAVAVKEINLWVSNLTQGKIPDLVDEEDVAGVVMMVLNTLYFKGSWRHQFLPNATKTAPFYVSPKIEKPVSFMNIKENFFFHESTLFDAKIFRMGYRGNQCAMYMIVPNSITGLNRVLTNLSELRAEMNNLVERLVDVTIPKFRFEYTSRLDGVLRNLGVRHAFEDSASFPGIARGQLLHQRLRISKVLQKSGIEVNELGSVVYSATEIGIVNKFGEDTDGVYEVVADKPFLFFIQDEMTQQLLFTGRVADPSLMDGVLKV